MRNCIFGGFYVNSHTLTCHLSDFDKNLWASYLGCFLTIQTNFAKNWPILTPKNDISKFSPNRRAKSLQTLMKSSVPPKRAIDLIYFWQCQERSKFAKIFFQNKKNTFFMDTRPKTAKWLRPKKIEHYPLRFLIKIDISYI